MKDEMNLFIQDPLESSPKGDKKESLLLQVAGNRNFQTDIINGYVTSFSQQHLWEFM
jgi:hypothetical protein